MTVREPSLDTMRRDATVIAAGRLPQGVDPERGAMREQRRLIAAVEQHQRVPQVLVGIGQPFLPGLMPYRDRPRSEEHTSELQSLMRISYAVFCLKTKIVKKTTQNIYNVASSTTNTTLHIL